MPCVPGLAESVWTQDQALHLRAVSWLPQPQADLILWSMLYPRPPARPPAISCSPRLFQPLGKPVSLVCHAKIFAPHNLLVTYLEAGLDGHSGEFFLAGCSCWQKEKNKHKQKEGPNARFLLMRGLTNQSRRLPQWWENWSRKTHLELCILGLIEVWMCCTLLSEHWGAQAQASAAAEVRTAASEGWTRRCYLGLWLCFVELTKTYNYFLFFFFIKSTVSLSLI